MAIKGCAVGEYFGNELQGRRVVFVGAGAEDIGDGALAAQEVVRQSLKH